MNNLPDRKRMRWDGYDYSKAGNYFVTLCLKDRSPALWIPNMSADDPTDPPLSSLGQVVKMAILNIGNIYPTVIVDTYCIMPDHIHMILFVESDKNGVTTSAPPISGVISQMKRWITRQTGKSLWQRSFYDRVIRTDKEYYAIRDYVYYNPIKIDGADDLFEWL